MKRTTWSNKEAVLGVTGSIAAYKACELASRLTELGVKVTPVLTESAAQLVGPASFEGITGQRAVTGMFEPLQNPEIEHIAVATRADLFLIAPATANVLAKAAHGMANDWLSTTLLATRAPILFAPAMNTNMYTHPATQANIATLRARGCHFVGPDNGRLACKTVGPGRLIDPGIILETALILMHSKKDLAGKRVLITSGGTHEPMDPVRYIGNRSSGKMGRALAFEALLRGASVSVVSGPCEAEMPHGADVIHAETAREMAVAVAEQLPSADVFVAAAAVADYRPAELSAGKRKRTGEAISITLEENPDILAGAGSQRRDGQVIVGFAAETSDAVAEGRRKLERKGAQILVANRVGPAGSGFGAEQLEAWLLDDSGRADELGRVRKDTVAQMVFDAVAERLP